MNKTSKSLNYGIGLFETMAVVQGHIQYLDRHLERLFDSMDALGVTYEITVDTLKNALESYVEEHTLRHCGIKVVIGDTTPVYTITHRNIPYDSSDYEKGMALSISEIRRHSSNPLLGHKSTNYWLNMYVREGLTTGTESLFLNEKGVVAEGTVSNIFLVTEEGIITPDVTCGLLPGIMRQQVIDQCSVLGIPIREGMVYPEDLLTATGLFITNSLMGVMPITSYLGFEKAVQPWMIQLMEVLNGT